jgi:hypothetical protein
MVRGASRSFRLPITSAAGDCKGCRFGALVIGASHTAG